MSTINKIVASISHTVNLGNYESARVEWTEEWELEEGDSVPEVHEKLMVATKIAVEAFGEKIVTGFTEKVASRNVAPDPRRR